MAKSHSSKKKRYEEGDADILQKVSDHLITKETLYGKLAQHVEKVSFMLFACYISICSFCKVVDILRSRHLQVDYEMALEYATQTGVREEPREDIYLQSLDSKGKFFDFHSPIFVFRLFL